MSVKVGCGMTTNDKASYRPGLSEIKVKDRDGKVVDKKPYLGAHDAVTWFKMDYPGSASAIIPRILDLESKLVRAEVYISGVLIAAATVRGDGQKSLEKLETAAVRRALAFAGYGTVSALAAENDEKNDSSLQAEVAMALHDKSPAEMRDDLNGGKRKKRV